MNTQTILTASPYPTNRLRRMRRTGWLRNIVAETHLSTKDLIQPLFIRDKDSSPLIETLPGQNRLSLFDIPKTIEKIADLDLQAVILFPFYEPEKRTENGLELLKEDNFLCKAISTIKRETPHIGVIVDLALDPYAAHGQDGIVKNGEILNDETAQVLANYAVVLARAGADVMAPSDMMDGRVHKIRQALDQNNFAHIPIMSYAAKYASSFYGPFREAVGSLTCLAQADKKTYQMDPANRAEALRECYLDIQEGADMLIVKPGLPYLDILARVKETFNLPTFTYHVSGEYSMLKLAAEQGILDYEQCLMETMMAFKRAGADGILTYAAQEVASFLRRT